MTHAAARPMELKPANISEQLQESLVYIAEGIETDPVGRSPKLRMMGMELKIGLSTAWWRATQLLEKGCLVGDSGKSRSLRLTPLGQATIDALRKAASDAAAKKTAQAAAKKKTRKKGPAKSKTSKKSKANKKSTKKTSKPTGKGRSKP